VQGVVHGEKRVCERDIRSMIGCSRDITEKKLTPTRRRTLNLEYRTRSTSGEPHPATTTLVCFKHAYCSMLIIETIISSALVKCRPVA
jgi:hypothetical protein